MLRKTKGGKWVVVSHKTGKQLSKPMSRVKAARRLAQIQYFKHKKG